MIAQFIEAPLEMQTTLKVPQPIYDQCKMYCIPTSWDAYGEYGYSEMTLKIEILVEKIGHLFLWFITVLKRIF